MVSVMLFLVVWFVSLVYGIYQSGQFIYKGDVAYSKKFPALKEIVAPRDVNTLSFCAIQCRMYPQCKAIEMCDKKETKLCRLCNFTNPQLTVNETDICRHLQLDNERDETDTCSKNSVFHTCKDILNNSNCGMVLSGVYNINIDGKPTDVWCDMNTDGGGWTVIQKRQSGITYFNRSWTEYKKGFGNVSDEYWIGNEALHILTTTRNVTLRVDLEQFNGTKGYGTWNTFRVDNEAENYGLSLSAFNGFNGNPKIYDCFSYHNGEPFCTYDNDNDDWPVGNCAVNRQGGWWFGSCHSTNLNGQYFTSATETEYGVLCFAWSSTTSLKTTNMMIR